MSVRVWTQTPGANEKAPVPEPDHEENTELPQPLGLLDATMELKMNEQCEPPPVCMSVVAVCLWLCRLIS